MTGKLHVVVVILCLTTVGVVVDMHFASSDIIARRSCLIYIRNIVLTRRVYRGGGPAGAAGLAVSDELTDREGGKLGMVAATCVSEGILMKTIHDQWL